MPKNKKSTWDKVQKQNAMDSVQYRDVYNDQQMERSKITDKQSPMSRIIFCIVCAVLTFIAVWAVGSMVQFGQASIHAGGSMSSQNAPTVTIQKGDMPTDSPYIVSKDNISSEGGLRTEYYGVDQSGNHLSGPYEEEGQVPKPDWYAAWESEHGVKEAETYGAMHYFRPTLGKFLFSLCAGILVFLLLYQVMMRNLEAQNLMSDTSDINQYTNDQHIMLPEEVQRKFDWFPDVGAHSNVQVSSMISHVALSNKGLKKIPVAKRADKDILDEDGDIEYYKHEILLDADGNPMTEMKPMIDEKFMDDLFEASGALKEKEVRKYYDATKIPYNPKNENRDKQKDCDTVADLINTDWELPVYEPQRPAGAYIVDTDPVNTLV